MTGFLKKVITFINVKISLVDIQAHLLVKHTIHLAQLQQSTLDQPTLSGFMRENDHLHMLDKSLMANQLIPGRTQQTPPFSSVLPGALKILHPKPQELLVLSRATSTWCRASAGLPMLPKRAGPELPSTDVAGFVRQVISLHQEGGVFLLSKRPRYNTCMCILKCLRGRGGLLDPHNLHLSGRPSNFPQSLYRVQNRKR